MSKVTTQRRHQNVDYTAITGQIKTVIAAQDIVNRFMGPTFPLPATVMWYHYGDIKNIRQWEQLFLHVTVFPQ